jgi:hypothetical protein
MGKPTGIEVPNEGYPPKGKNRREEKKKKPNGTRVPDYMAQRPSRP